MSTLSETQFKMPGEGGNTPPSPIEFNTTRMTTRTDVWYLFGRNLPKAEVEYFCQIFLIYVVVIASIINVSLGHNVELFMTLLGMSLGAILPSPKVKKPITNNSD